MDFSEYYQRELDYLLESGHRFSNQHSNARHLVARSNNPYAERILEGVAFLTAKLHQRIDSGFPEVIEPILEMVAPQFLAPVPSCSILAFEPELSSSRAAKLLPEGTQVASRPNEAAERPACLFRTTHPTKLLPVRIASADYVVHREGPARLTIELETHEAGRIALQKAGRLEFFVNGELPIVSALLLALEQHCTGVFVRETQGKRHRLESTPLALPAFDAERRLLPWSQGQSLRSHRLIAEYAVLPEAFHFFEVRGFEALHIQQDRFRLEFEFDAPPELAGNIHTDTFHLHCVPVINLFEVSGDPLKVSALGSPRLIRAQELGPHDMEVFDLHDVEAQPEGGGPSEVVQPYYRFAQVSRRDEQKPNYSLTRSVSPVDGGLDTSLHFCNWTPANQKARGGTRIVSTELRCTNRHHPRALGVGDLCEQPKRGRKVPCAFRNLVAPTVPVRVGSHTSLQWRLAALMSLRRGNLQELAQLRALFELYEEFGALASREGGKVSFASAILSVDTKPLVSPVRGEIWSGIQIELELDASSLKIGPTYMLARLINEVFAANVAVNAFVQVQARCTSAGSGVLASWSFPRRFASRDLR